MVDNSFDDITAIMGRKRRAVQRYSGRDDDKDFLDDGREIDAGGHSFKNKPYHRLNGPSTPGPMHSGPRGAVVPYSSHVIDLGVGGQSTKNIGKPYTMPTPKKMKLTVPMGDTGKHDQSKFKVNIAKISPHKHTLDDSKIKNIGIPKSLITGGKNLNFSHVGKIKRNKKVLP
jgi:hypothetical protein